MGSKRPSFASNSADELATVIDGSYFANRKPVISAMGRPSSIGILWMAYLARQYPDPIHHREPRQLPPAPKTPNDLALPLNSGQVRDPLPGYLPQTGCGREAICRRQVSPTRTCQMTCLRHRGRARWMLVDQTDIFPILTNTSFQDHANEAIHHFIS